MLSLEWIYKDMTYNTWSLTQMKFWKPLLLGQLLARQSQLKEEIDWFCKELTEEHYLPNEGTHQGTQLGQAARMWS